MNTIKMMVAVMSVIGKMTGCRVMVTPMFWAHVYAGSNPVTLIMVIK